MFYSVAQIRGDRSYRVFGVRGEETYISFTVHSEAVDGGFNGRVLADINAVPSVGTSFPSDSVTEPTVAVSPFDPNLVALVYQRETASSYCGLDTGIRISHDGGRTWQNAPGRPWTGTGR